MVEILKQWQFEDPPETLVLVEKKVINDNLPVLYALRSRGKNRWLFSWSEAVDPEKLVIVRLMDIVELDRSILNICRLPDNWSANRTTAAAAWMLKPPVKRGLPHLT